MKATEQEKERMRKYFKENKEKIYLRAKEHRLKNLDEIVARERKWRQENGDKIRERHKAWVKKNKPIKTHRSKIEPRIKLNARRYAEKRKVSMEKICGICKSPLNIEIHHWRYDKPYKNRFNLLCSTCHRIQHIRNFYNSKYSGGNELVTTIQ